MTFTQRKFASTAGKLSLLTMVLMAAPFAMAADSSGWFGGLNLGQTNATIDNARITSDLSSRGLTAGPIDNNDQDRGFKLFGGYQFNPYFSAEAGYFDLGQFGYATTTPTGTLSGRIRLKGLHLDAVGTLPITGKFSAFARVGATYAQAKDHFVGTGAVRVLDPNPSSRDTNLKVGLGVQYAFTEQLSLRAEIERYRINDAVGNKGDIDLASIGLVYRFGAKAQPPGVRR